MIISDEEYSDLKARSESLEWVLKGADSLDLFETMQVYTKTPMPPYLKHRIEKMQESGINRMKGIMPPSVVYKT